MIIVIILQEGNTQGLGTITGGADTFLSKNKARSLDAFLARWTKFFVVGFVIGFLIYLRKIYSIEFLLVMIIITFVGSIIGQLGDLLASGIKRDHKIKDYGNVIPGHGGIMDRFDSVIFVIPCVYFLAAVLVPLIE